MTNVEIVYHPLIIPTIVVPFAFVLAGLSALATFIAGLFGLKLKAEGPKKLLEVLLKPRVIAAAVVMNVVAIGAWQGYRYVKNAPVMLWRIEREQSKLAQPSELDYGATTKQESKTKDIRLVALGSHPPQGHIETVWTQKLSAGSFRGALVVGEALFIGTNDGFVRELDSKTGETRRSFFIGQPVSAGVTIHDGHLFAAEGVHDIHDARVYKFNLKTGQFVGAYGSRGGHIEGQPTIAKGKTTDIILVPSGKDGLAAVDAKTMQKIWHAKEGHVDSAARDEGGLVFSATGLEKENTHGSKGIAYAFDLETGKKVWEKELPASSWMRPVTWRDRVCFVFGEVYFPSGLGGVYCFRQSDGTPDIAYNQAAPIAAEPILIGDDVVVSDIKGKVCRVSLETGKAEWCQETGAAKRAFPNPRYDERLHVLVYPSESNGLFVLDPDSGAVLTQWKGEGQKDPWFKTLAPAAIMNDGWIVVDLHGVIRKVRYSANASLAVLNPPRGQ